MHHAFYLRYHMSQLEDGLPMKRNLQTPVDIPSCVTYDQAIRDSAIFQPPITVIIPKT